jgi:hypothetical protein
VARVADGANASIRRPEPESPQPLRVEVRSRFDGAWCRGFTVDEADVREDGSEWFRVRRDTDGMVLPAWFRADDVIVEHRLD